MNTQKEKYLPLTVAATLACGLASFNAAAATCADLEASLTAIGNNIYAAQHVNVLYCLSLYPSGYGCGSDTRFHIESQVSNGSEQRRNGYRYVGPPSTGSVVALWYTDWQSCADQYTITLDQTSADLQPALAAADTDTFKIFVATVKDGKNGVKANTPVTVKADVEQGSGGHVHLDTLQRPKGYLYSDQTKTSCDSAQPAACITGSTDTNGQFAFTFLASQVSGKHTVTVTCDVCNGGKADLAIKVAVKPDLKPIPASQFYTLYEANGDVIGAVTGNHTDNHYLAPEAAIVLWRIAAAFNVEKQFAFIDPATNQQLVLHLNDASLEWGGRV